MKRLIALLLAAVMLLSLAACGGAGGETVAETAAPISDGEEYHGEMPIVKPGDEPITISIGLKTNSNVTDYKNNDLTKWLEETTGLNLEFVQFGGSNSENATQLALMIASGEKLPDILDLAGISTVQPLEYGRDGYYIDLAPYFEKYAYYHKEAFARLFPDDPSVREKLMRCSTEPDSGAIYTFPLEENADTPICHAWINQTWLDKLGLQMPRTVEELREVLIAFRDKDPNGNGLQDEIPMTGKAGTSAYNDILRVIVNAFIYWNFSAHFNVGEGDKLYTPYTEDEYRQALIYMSDLVKDGLLSTLTWTQSTEELRSLFNPADDEPEKCGIITGHRAYILPGNRMLYDYEPFPPLKAATPKGGYGARRNHNYSLKLHITSSCEHPVEAFKLLDLLCSDEGFLRCRYGVPGRDWEFSDEQADERGGMKLRLLDGDVWTTQNSIHWHETWTINDTTYHKLQSSGDEWANLALEKGDVRNLRNYIDAGLPEKLFTNVAYTLEEYEKLSEFEKELTDFISDRRAQFCTGVLDPRDDAQWQAYLDNLKALRYDEWVEIAQTAYDRMQK